MRYGRKPHMLRNMILMILLFCRTLLPCLEAEISVKIELKSLRLSKGEEERPPLTS